jgi:hypothetical protein
MKKPEAKNIVTLSLSNNEKEAAEATELERLPQRGEKYCL